MAMQTEDRCMELTGDLFQEFEETRKLTENEDDVTYSTWSRACSSFYTIISLLISKSKGESVCAFALFLLYRKLSRRRIFCYE